MAKARLVHEVCPVCRQRPVVLDERGDCRSCGLEWRPRTGEWFAEEVRLGRLYRSQGGTRIRDAGWQAFVEAERAKALVRRADDGPGPEAPLTHTERRLVLSALQAGGGAEAVLAGPLVLRLVADSRRLEIALDALAALHEDADDTLAELLDGTRERLQAVPAEVTG